MSVATRIAAKTYRKIAEDPHGLREALYKTAVTLLGGLLIVAGIAAKSSSDTCACVAQIAIDQQPVSGFSAAVSKNWPARPEPEKFQTKFLYFSADEGEGDSAATGAARYPDFRSPWGLPVLTCRHIDLTRWSRSVRVTGILSVHPTRVMNC